MKTIILMATILLTFSAVNAQISEVKQESGYYYIYDSGGNHLGTVDSKRGEYKLLGYNSKYVVIEMSGYAYVHDSSGNTGCYTCGSIELKGGTEIVGVNESEILVKISGNTYKYGFDGRIK